MQFMADPPLFSLAYLQDFTLQPLALGHFPPERKRAVLHACLEVPLRRSQIAEQADDDNIEHSKNESVPGNNPGLGIMGPRCQVASQPYEDTQHRHDKPEPPADKPGRN